MDSEVEPVEEPVALSPERNEKNMMNQLQTKLIERVKDTGTHV